MLRNVAHRNYLRRNLKNCFMVKKHLLFTCCILTFSTYAQSTQADSLLLDLANINEQTKLLPERMLLTQRLFWDRKDLIEVLELLQSLLSKIERNMKTNVV